MGLWDKVKASTRKTRLQGEVLLLEREIKNRKLAFGIELYDLLVADDSTFRSGVSGSTVMAKASAAMTLNSNAMVFHLQEEQLRILFDACRSDIRDLEYQQDQMRNEQELCQASRQRGEPATTASEKLAKAGQWVSSNATETKLEAQIKLLDRDIRKRKEQFGLLAFDDYVAKGLAELQVTSPLSKGVKGSLRERLGARMSSFNPKERRIQECLDRAKNAVGLLQRQVDLKHSEMESLDQIIKTPPQRESDGGTAATDGNAIGAGENKNNNKYNHT